MKKYKVTKPIPWFWIHDEYIWESILLRNEYLLENWFIEEIKEEEKPKFRIWDKVSLIDWFWIITAIIPSNNTYCVWNSYFTENLMDLANPEEIQEYFN